MPAPPLSVTQALLADRAGQTAQRARIRETLLAAVRADPANLPLAARTFNHLLYSGAPRPPRDTLTDLIVANTSDPARLTSAYLAPSANCLLYAGQLDEAARTLALCAPHSEPAGALLAELRKWQEARDGPVVGWERLGTRWWQTPAVLPSEHDGASLSRWMACIVQSRELNLVHLRCGEADPDHPDRPQLSWAQIPYDRWLADGGSPLEDRQAPADSFWELGVYPAANVTLLRPAPTGGVRRALPEPDPPPWRYVR